MGAAWLCGEAELQESWNNPSNEWMDCRENSQTQKLGPEFPFCVFHKRWSECQGFSSNGVFELLCLSVDSPLSLRFFLQISASFPQTCWLLALACGIPLKSSSSSICVLWASDFLKNAFTSLPRLSAKGFSVRHFSVYWTSQLFCH